MCVETLLRQVVVSPHLQTGLSPLTAELLKSEIREFVAWRAGQTTALRAWSCNPCLRGHMHFTSTAVHVLDNQAVFGTVSNSGAMKCQGEKKILRLIRLSLRGIARIVFTLLLSFAFHHMS